ncbi:MAG: D-alanyl-D-alanine carboxypeptidase/D-alanyl-D-alanine endopeptidase, partial [Planctomycetota bacterium]
LLIAAVFGIALVTTASADLTRQVDAVISRPSQRKVQFSVHIVKADSGKTIYSHNATKPMVPASNMKIITTAAALEFLGPDYEYKTQVGLSDNDLVVIGSGDPLLSDKVTDAKYNRQTDWFLKDIAKQLKQNRITAVKDIVVDTGVFDDERVHPSWPEKELNRWYACEVSGLNFNSNCIQVSAKNIGGKVNVLIEPQTNYITVINKVILISKGKSTIGSYRNQTPNTIVVHGKCKDEIGPFTVAIERPAAFFGFLLAETLAKDGIAVQGQFIEKKINPEKKFKKLTQYKTKLSDCLARCNKDSFGLAAESLLKTIAANTSPYNKKGSWLTGSAQISQYLQNLGIDRKQFTIDDGSGLSRENKLSANAITKVLLNVYESNNWVLYKDSLAVGGVDGTIRRYFKEEKYKAKVFGKTGYLTDVKTFSGLCTTNDGDYLFSILANKANAQTRTALNDIAKAIIDNADK